MCPDLGTFQVHMTEIQGLKCWGAGYENNYRERLCRNEWCRPISGESEVLEETEMEQCGHSPSMLAMGRDRGAMCLGQT